jgi:pimeloyl-ACP methyl ester carboxylesterase
MGTWMATRYAIARPDRVERLALVGPSGIVSPQHARWILRGLLDVRLRPSPAKIEAFVDSLAVQQTWPRMRTDPWRPIVQQLVTGLATFRRGLREARPVPCNIRRLADSGIPVLAIIGREETLHDGATMAERFRQRLPDAQVRLVDDANHLVFIDQQDLVAEELRTFFKP